MSDRVLAIDAISKRYGPVVAVDELSLDVRAGELLGFVGRNGAGKTTTMRIVLGVLEPDAGSVRWQGIPLELSSRRRIGYMPEARGLYPKMRLEEQLTYLGEIHGLAGAAAQAAAQDWLERFGLADRARAELSSLSQGNQQRMQLAAALIFTPDILVLDEPFASLDPVAVDLMSAVLREQADSGVAVVFSSHELDLVERLCDRVAIIEQGKIIAAGSVVELRAGGPRRLWVDAPDAPPDWPGALPGVTALARRGTRRLLELAPEIDDQAVLAAAQATGPVREFAPAAASLGEIFRAAIEEEQP
jgi:ABC-2 type transport system ATP-binding protein